jgi:transposase-like protein
LLKKQSKTQLAQKHKINRKTLIRWFNPFWQFEPQSKLVNVRNKVVVLDAKFTGKNVVVLVGCCETKVCHYSFAQRENFDSWSIYLSSFNQSPLAAVVDGKRGLKKALETKFPDIIIQRCQFHVMKYILTKLTKKPKAPAAQELKELTLLISRIKTKNDLRQWLGQYKLWWQTYHKFVKEKTYSETQLTKTGRRKWHYTHGRLHAACSHLKNAFPNLFKYLLHPQIPNTTNIVEGSINAKIADLIHLHRGLNSEKKQVLTATFLASKQ